MIGIRSISTGTSEAMMKANYEWLTVDGQRVFRVTNTQTRKHIDIPLDAGLARISGSGLHGAQSDQELLVAKVVCDRNADIDALERWLAGPDRPGTIKKFQDLLAERDRELAYWKEQAAKAASAAGMPRE
jgi:hypothetical protein